MNYLTNTFAINNNDIQKQWKYIKNANIITIECNSKNGKSKEINGENSCPIIDLEQYTEENRIYLETSYQNYLYCMKLKFKIENLITEYNLKVEEDYYEWSVLNKVFHLVFRVYKITLQVQFSICFTDDEFSLTNKIITDEQLLFFLENNKLTINGKNVIHQFTKKINCEVVSDEYKKLFIKRPMIERICTQTCKETCELDISKYKEKEKEEEKQNDDELEKLQKIMKRCLKI